MSKDDCLNRLAERQHGAFSHKQAREAGYSRDAIKRRVRAGRWLTVHRATYVLPGAPRTEEQRVIAAVLSMGPRAAAASITAAWLNGLIDRPPHAVYVALPSGQHRRARRGIVLIEAALTRSDVRTVNGIRVTAPNRTIVDMAAVLPREPLGAVFDEAVVHGLTSVAALRRYIKERRLGHRRGARNLRLVLDDRTKGVTQKGLEKIFLRKLRAAGLPEPARQHPVGKYFIDFAYPNARIAIELDGLRDHFSADAFRKDRRRQNEIVLADYTILRFTWEDIDDRWPAVEAVLRRAIDSA